MKALDNESKLPLTLKPLTASGHPAKVDGVPIWDSSNPQAFTVEVAEDGLSGFIVSADTGADVQTGVLTVTADADLGEGVKPLVFTETIAVGPAEAESFGVEFGAALPK